MDYYDFIDRLNKILLPTSTRHDAIYNKLIMGSSGGHGYVETNPLISIDDQLLASNIDQLDKIRILEMFCQVESVIKHLEGAILAEQNEIKSITIIQSILNPKLKETSKKRIKELSFYLEWLNRLNSRHKEDRLFWDNLLKEIEITV